MTTKVKISVHHDNFPVMFEFPSDWGEKGCVGFLNNHLNHRKLRTHLIACRMHKGLSIMEINTIMDYVKAHNFHEMWPRTYAIKPQY